MDEKCPNDARLIGVSPCSLPFTNQDLCTVGGEGKGAKKPVTPRPCFSGFDAFPILSKVLLCGWPCNPRQTGRGFFYFLQNGLFCRESKGRDDLPQTLEHRN